MTDRTQVRVAGRLAAVQAVAPRRRHAAPPPEQNGDEEARRALSEQTAAARRAQQAAEQERQAAARARLALEHALAEVEKLQSRIVAEAESQLVDLSVQIAAKVLAQEIQAERHDVERIVREALKHVPMGRQATVYLHPADLARCEAPAEAGKTTLVADGDLQPGECRVECEDGVVESRIDPQLRDIHRALKGVE